MLFGPPQGRPTRKPPLPLPLPDQVRTFAPLPAPLTSLVGRDRETAAVLALLRRKSVRLVTLTGPAGVGKTRLAIRVAERMADDVRDGVCFVALGAVLDPDLVLSTIARSLGVWESPDRTMADQLSQHLRSRQLLLVLDNFEQVARAASLLSDLLMACGGLSMLVTSRSTLHVSVEHVYVVPPLAVPDLDQPPPLAELARMDAVRLFVQRATAVRTGFSLSAENTPIIAAICRRLDGLPLALELAAARSAHLPPSAILARLTPTLSLLTGGPLDAPARQQTMRDAISWSYDLLDEDERMVVQRTSIFAGTFTLEGAEAVAFEGHADHEALDVIAALVDKSLLWEVEAPGQEPRFTMLEAVREFGREQLPNGDGALVQEAHAEYLLGLAEQAAPLLLGPEQRRWLDRLESELPDLRMAFAWLHGRHDSERQLRLASALALLWYLRNHLREGEEIVNQALDGSGGRPSAALAGAQRAAGMLAFARGDFAVAVSRLRASLETAQRLDDSESAARTLFWLALTAEYEGDDVSASADYQRALAICGELGDPLWTALVLHALGDTATRAGDLERADALCSEGLRLAREVGDKWVIWSNLQAWGNLQLARGAWDLAALAHWEELQLALDIGDLRGVADGLAGLAGVAVGRGHAKQGARLLGAADSLREAIGRRMLPGHAQFERTMAAARDAIGEAQVEAAWSAGGAMELAQAIEAARAIALPASGQAGGVEVAVPAPSLTTRELEVLRLLVDGRSDRQIAASLFVSPRTASGHVASIMSKLDAASRTEAAVRAVRSGLV